MGVCTHQPWKSGRHFLLNLPITSLGVITTGTGTLAVHRARLGLTVRPSRAHRYLRGARRLSFWLFSSFNTCGKQRFGSAGPAAPHPASSSHCAHQSSLTPLDTLSPTAPVQKSLFLCFLSSPGEAGTVCTVQVKRHTDRLSRGPGLAAIPPIRLELCRLCLAAIQPRFVTCTSTIPPGYEASPTNDPCPWISTARSPCSEECLLLVTWRQRGLVSWLRPGSSRCILIFVAHFSLWTESLL